MASSDISTSSQVTAAAAEEHRRTVDEAFLNKMKVLVERLRLENATLKKSLDLERSGVRAIKAQNEANVRYLKTEHKKKEESLEKQLRVTINNEKPSEDGLVDNGKLLEIKKLTTEIQFLKAANKGLHEKVKVTQAAEMARTAELRAQIAKHAAVEAAARKDARAQCHKLLEEIKSKERVIVQLRREVTRVTPQDYDQAHPMDCGRKHRVDQNKQRSEVMEVQHRKALRREPDRDSAVSSAPTSLSPHPPSDMWSCGQCRAALDRAAAASRECTRLSDALRDARDQLELMEFRLLELEDAAPEKGARDNLTDTDSGCVSPGSRIKDSASPELKRMDSGYKSPNTPSSPATARRSLKAPNSPCDIRRTCATPHDDYREEFAKAQVLADILDRSSDSDSLRSNPVKDHLEQMILNAASAEDRNCLEQVLMLLYNLQTLSSSVSEDECYQTKPKRISELKQHKTEPDIPLHKTQKAIATVTPYQQKGYKSESFESLCGEERKTANSILQESGIFEGVETETEVKGTQTDANEIFECTGELNTEIQRLNSIREKLEKQGVRNRSLSKDDGESLECRCVKLGKKHKQYYERRLKFLEGKISIYEAAQDVKESKLAQRLQNEYLLENRIQELEFQLTDLQDKYERLEEECCELEEIENDTRLHWQQLELDYELCSAQLRDMTEQHKCTKGEAERLIKELTNKEYLLRNREGELTTKLKKLEEAVPALIAWNVVKAMNCKLSQESKQQLQLRLAPYSNDTKEFRKQLCCSPFKSGQIDTKDCSCKGITKIQELEKQIYLLNGEKNKMERETEKVKIELERKIEKMQNDYDNARRQIEVLQTTAEIKEEQLDKRILELQNKVDVEKIEEQKPADCVQNHMIATLKNNEESLKQKILELEKREKAYLEMLTQADDLWAEMEGGYKTKIEESQKLHSRLKGQIDGLTVEKDRYKNCIEKLRKKIKEIEESESCMRIALEKAERDKKTLNDHNTKLSVKVQSANDEILKSETVLKNLESTFKKEVEDLRRVNKCLDQKLSSFKDEAVRTEKKQLNDLDSIRKELHRMSKYNQDLEVTNGELKEEVESLEKQLSLTQKSLSQCKRKCDEKIKTLSHELSIKTEELEELRCETMRQSLQASRIDIQPDKTEYIDEGYPIYTAVPKKTDYGRMHHSLSYISESRCSCPSMRSQLVGQLIEDLFDRMHGASDEDLSRLCNEMSLNGKEVTAETKAKIMNYLLMAISKELVRSIGDADAKTDTEEWQRAVSSMTYSGTMLGGSRRTGLPSLRLEGNAGVVAGAARLASVSCACAAARLCAAVPVLADAVKICQEEVLDHGDVKIMEEQLANAIESIVNCPSCALGTNAIVWSTDV